MVIGVFAALPLYTAMTFNTVAAPARFRQCNAMASSSSSIQRAFVGVVLIPLLFAAVTGCASAHRVAAEVPGDSQPAKEQANPVRSGLAFTLLGILKALGRPRDGATNEREERAKADADLRETRERRERQRSERQEDQNRLVEAMRRDAADKERMRRDMADPRMRGAIELQERFRQQYGPMR